MQSRTAFVRSAGLSLLALSAACSTASREPTESVGRDNQDLYGLGAIGAAWPGGNVPICFADTRDHPTLQAQIPGILASSWSKAANLHFSGYGPCPSTGSFVKIQFSTAPGFRGNTSGYGNGNPVVTLLSDDTIAPQSHFTYEVIHEVGHALGFAHEMQRPDNWNGGVATQCQPPLDHSDDGNYNAIAGGTNLTPAYDPYSIMSYCDPGGYQI